MFDFYLDEDGRRGARMRTKMVHVCLEGVRCKFGVTRRVFKKKGFWENLRVLVVISKPIVKNSREYQRLCCKIAGAFLFLTI